MRTIRTKVYKFEELSKEAKEKAVEQLRNQYYTYNDFAEWAVDDCALLEPKHKELEELFAEYYDFPLIKNTREQIYFDTERNRFLDIENAIEITNDKQFLLWLGIDTNNKDLENIEYTILTPNYKNSSTTIDFSEYPSDYDNLIENAVKKFDGHIQDILVRIKSDIDYRFSDEAIKEDILANDYEFLKDGTLYN